MELGFIGLIGLDTEQKTIEKIVLPTDSLTESIIGCAMRVHAELGCGFLEKVYENVLAIELRHAGHQVVQQPPISVMYHGERVGDYAGDILVDNAVVVELKATRDIDEVFLAICKHYLKATSLNVCLLINFGRPSLQFKRILKDKIR